jgi:hypothetical protein
MVRVFLSYRREDTQGWAGRIHDRLTSELGVDHVFMDVATIEPGQEFSEVITDSISECSTLIAVLGPRWSACVNSRGCRRLDDPNDFIRREIAVAFEHNVQVVPVLVDGTTMPTAEELPAELAKLPHLQALEVNASHFDADMSRLIDAITPKAKAGLARAAFPLAAGSAAFTLVVALALAFVYFSGSSGNGTPRPDDSDSADNKQKQESTPSPASAREIRSIAGRWSGTFTYPNNLPIPFEATLLQDGDRITGQIEEKSVVKSVDFVGRMLRGEASPEEAEESLRREVAITEGAVHTDGRVTFVKDYKGQGGMFDRVEYQGALNQEQTTISGTWHGSTGLSGSFTMHRESAAAATE